MGNVKGFILAGGESSRMGRPKGLLELGGVPGVVRIARLLEAVTGPPVIVGLPERYAGLGFPAIADEPAGVGPLGGIATALGASEKPWSLIVGCDLPFLTAAWLEYLARRAVNSEWDVILPRSEGGLEPLCAIYHKRALEAIVPAIKQGVHKVTDGLAGLNIETILASEWKAFDSDGRLFKNMNTREEYEAARRMFEGKAEP